LAAGSHSDEFSPARDRAVVDTFVQIVPLRLRRASGLGRLECRPKLPRPPERFLGPVARPPERTADRYGERRRPQPPMFLPSELAARWESWRNPCPRPSGWASSPYARSCSWISWRRSLPRSQRTAGLPLGDPSGHGEGLRALDQTGCPEACPATRRLFAGAVSSVGLPQFTALAVNAGREVEPTHAIPKDSERLAVPDVR
jgi:hypothetical protein